MNQTQINLVRLAALSRNDKKQFKAVCELAQKLSMPKRALKTPRPSAQAQRLQNFVGAKKVDLLKAGARFGFERVGNLLGAQSIYETAQRKFAEMATKREGK